MARRLRSFCSAAALMLSYSGERWLISMTDMPLPRQSSSSSLMRSRTGRGRAAGPALKLKMRFVVGAEAVVVLTVMDPLELMEALLAFGLLEGKREGAAFVSLQNKRITFARTVYGGGGVLKRVGIVVWM